MATYDYLKSKNGHKIQVESAKRDGAGKNIENNYAKQNGYYAQLTSGNADQLNSTIFVTDQVPYLFRTSGGDADIGNREYDKIIGGSLAVNQLVQNGNFDGITNWNKASVTLSSNNNIGTITKTITYSYARLQTTVPKVNGHKYLFMLQAKDNVGSGNLLTITWYLDGDSGSTQPIISKTLSSSWQNISNIVTATSTSSTAKINIHPNNVVDADVGNSIDVKNVIVIDLTQILGSTIADYIYSLEQANTGAGVSWFRQYFQELYYPYNTGAIKNVQLISHDMVGFNQWDEQWEEGGYDISTGQKVSWLNAIRSKNYCRALPNTKYNLQFNTAGFWILWYDENKNYIGYTRKYLSDSDKTTTSPSNAAWFNISTNNDQNGTYKNDICINLSWSGWRNGQYEPYKKNSYPLDTTIELRGVPKLDADNNLYFDGDEYTYDGKVVRKYGIVDLGTLNYTKNGTSPNIYFAANISGLKKTTANTDLLNVSCSKYTAIQQSIWYTRDKVIFGLTNQATIAIRDVAYNDTDAATFKTAMSGVMLVYELATSTEETAEPYQEIQIVDDFGTEEYVVPTQDGWQIPVGHDTKYPANLRDKLQRLPDMPSVSQNVTETYVVNYNGTTKKCTFAEINTWLSSNGYEKQVDLSDQITDVAGLTYQCKKAIKIGNVVTITIQAGNSTGNSINAGDTLFKIGSALQPLTTIVCFCRIPGANTAIDLGASGVSGNCTLGSALSNGASMRFTVSYIVA